jgi:succinate dehydrogenase / fumarate reductase iron-sulfur subunit
LTSSTYNGPAILAGAQQNGELTNDILTLVDSENGAWRCHSAFECTEVCPSNVDPAWRIMDLRKKIIRHHLKQIFGSK